MKSNKMKYAVLKTRFTFLCDSFFLQKDEIELLWREIEGAYLGKKRVYHNLDHLVNLFAELDPIKEEFTDFKTVSWSVFYHDIIYNVRKQNNEEKSAELAVERLKQIGYPNLLIKKCEEQIIATKSHAISKDMDTNLFTDADLAILGKGWEVYKTYFEAIRKEYSIYPNIVYMPARKKVLLHFMEMPNLYKTVYFQDRYEKQARKNIERELFEKA